jgi:HPt (histidine-containing phosphotransfer) domain-containing protein
MVVAVDRDIIDLAERFLNNRRGQAQEWIEAVETGNDPVLLRLGHEIKGTAGAFGFHALADLGEELEEAVSADDLAHAEDTLERMIAFLERVTVVPR